MFVEKPSFNNWYKDIAELSQYINLDISDQDFLDLFNVSLLSVKTGLTVCAGVAFNNTALSDLKLKRKLLKKLNIVLDSLSKIKTLEHDEVKKELTIAIDNAEESLMVLFEFSELITVVTILSVPAEVEKQHTYHVRKTIHKSLTLTSVSSIFNYKSQQFFKNCKELEELKDREQLDKSFYICIDFKTYSCNEAISRVSATSRDIKYIYFNLNTSNEIVKRARLEYILKYLNTYIDDAEHTQDFNYLLLEINTIRSLMGPYPSLLKL